MGGKLSCQPIKLSNSSALRLTGINRLQRKFMPVQHTLQHQMHVSVESLALLTSHYWSLELSYVLIISNWHCYCFQITVWWLCHQACETPLYSSIWQLSAAGLKIWLFIIPWEQAQRSRASQAQCIVSVKWNSPVKRHFRSLQPGLQGQCSTNKGSQGVCPMSARTNVLRFEPLLCSYKPTTIIYLMW